MSEKRPTGSRGGFGPGGGPIRGVEKAKNFKGTMSRLIKYLSKYNVSILVVILFAMASTAFSIVGPKILGKATTKIFEGVMGKISGEGVGIDFKYIGDIILMLVVLYAISAVFLYIQGYIMSGVSMKVTYQFRKDISQKINRIPLKYYDSTTHGEILSRVTNDVDMVSQTLNQSLTQLITSVATVIGVAAMMFSISWMMTLVSLLIIPLSIILISAVIKRSQKYFKDQQRFLGNVNGHIEEVYGGQIVVKAFNGEQKAVNVFNGLNEKLYSTAWKSQFLSGMMMPIMSFIGNIGFVAVCIMGGWLAVKKTIELGDIQAFIQYVRQFNQPIAQLANVSNTLQSTAAAAERVFEFLDVKEEIPESDNPVKLENVRGNVTFENVHFGYDPEKIIINNFSVDVKPGQKIAIVGPTGAGKTTMVKLLMRFYDVSSGSIKIDGVDIRDMKREDIRSMLGMVLQDAWLYNDTIRENIRYGRLDATDEEVEEAAKTAEVRHFVRTLPDGYNTVLNEETTNVSQGQKQLLTIARAVLKDPKILILDEATSSVDTRTEVRIKKAMERLMEGRTSFIIAHRLSTIRDADLILVMKDGDIVEQGSHVELLAKNGFYASLYNSQFTSGDESA